MTIIKPSFRFEKFHQGTVAGIDEAGCGPWAGPVVAAAVVIDQSLFDSNLSKLINDSKKISKNKREMCFGLLLNHQAICYGVGQASVSEIDEINIGQATKLAMIRALSNLSSKPDYIIIDGIRSPQIETPVQMIVKGDQHSFTIAAASIIAKVTRDQIMEELHNQYPQYKWKNNAGYGTEEHRLAMEKHGITEHHRRSYAPVKAFL